jgi:hypothetical protein
LGAVSRWLRTNQNGETVDLKMTATADLLYGLVRLQAVVDDRGKEKKVPLLVKVDYTQYRSMNVG